MSENEIQRLSKLDEGSLELMLGRPIVRAVQQSYNTNMNAVLAELVILKLGESLLDKKINRLAIIDTLNPRELFALSSYIGEDFDNYTEALTFVGNYFSKGYNKSKSKELVDGLGFSEKFYKTEVIDDRLEVDIVNVSYGEATILKGYLHPYQKDIKDQVLSKLVNPGTRLMVQMPTGAGKTFTALETAVDILRRPFQRKFVVWLVNSNELAEQALLSFTDLWKIKGDRPLSVFRWFKDFVPDFREHDNGGMVFASYDLFYSVLRNVEDERRAGLLHLINTTEYLIVDEAHASIAETYEPCVSAFVNNDVTQILGLSATPFRNDAASGEALKRLYSNNLVSLRNPDGSELLDAIRYLQEKRYLAKIKVEPLETGVTISGHNEKKILKALAEDGERNNLILRQIKHAHEINDKTLVFACTVDHVLALYIMCKANNIPVHLIIGDTPQSERPKILKEFNDGETNVLINLDILSTGIDLPKVNRLIITRPINSDIMYSQIVGRALRGPLNGGNEINTIVNVIDNIEYFSGVSLLYNGFKNAWEG